MKVHKAFVFPAALFFVSLSTIFSHRVFSATHNTIILNGSGPIFSDPMKPGNRVVTVTVNNLTNLNVGYDFIDQGNNSVIANGTIKDKGIINKNATTLAGHTYKLRLRCQEPPWNNTECMATGWVDW